METRTIGTFVAEGKVREIGPRAKHLSEALDPAARAQIARITGQGVG